MLRCVGSWHLLHVSCITRFPWSILLLFSWLTRRWRAWSAEERSVPAAEPCRWCSSSWEGPASQGTGSKPSPHCSALHTHPELWVRNVRKDLFLLKDHQEVKQLLQKPVPSKSSPVAQVFIHILNYEKEMLRKICSCWRIIRRSKFYRNRFQVFSTSLHRRPKLRVRNVGEISVPAGGSPGGQTFTETGSKSALPFIDVLNKE